MPFPSETPSQGAVEPLMERKSLYKQPGTPVCTEQFTKRAGQYEELKSVMQCYSIKVSAVTKKPKLCGLTCSVPDIPYEAT